jgi:hypothetical protein
MIYVTQTRQNRRRAISAEQRRCVSAETAQRSAICSDPLEAFRDPPPPLLRVHLHRARPLIIYKLYKLYKRINTAMPRGGWGGRGERPTGVVYNQPAWFALNQHGLLPTSIVYTQPGVSRPQRRRESRLALRWPSWSNTGRILVKYWLNTGQIPAGCTCPRSCGSNAGQILVKYWSISGRFLVRCFSCRWFSGKVSGCRQRLAPPSTRMMVK